MKLTIEGDLWTYWNEEDDNGKHVRFRTTNRFHVLIRDGVALRILRRRRALDFDGEGRDTREVTRCEERPRWYALSRLTT